MSKAKIEEKFSNFILKQLNSFWLIEILVQFLCEFLNKVWIILLKNIIMIMIMIVIVIVIMIIS